MMTRITTPWLTERFVTIERTDGDQTIGDLVVRQMHHERFQWPHSKTLDTVSRPEQRLPLGSFAIRETAVNHCPTFQSQSVLPRPERLRRYLQQAIEPITIAGVDGRASLRAQVADGAAPTLVDELITEAVLRFLHQPLGGRDGSSPWRRGQRQIHYLKPRLDIVLPPDGDDWQTLVATLGLTKVLERQA